jgi:hypothetical protein
MKTILDTMWVQNAEYVMLEQVIYTVSSVLWKTNIPSPNYCNNLNCHWIRVSLHLLTRIKKRRKRPRFLQYHIRLAATPASHLCWKVYLWFTLHRMEGLRPRVGSQETFDTWWRIGEASLFCNSIHKFNLMSPYLKLLASQCYDSIWMIKVWTSRGTLGDEKYIQNIDHEFSWIMAIWNIDLSWKHFDVKACCSHWLFFLTCLCL